MKTPHTRTLPAGVLSRSREAGSRQPHPWSRPTTLLPEQIAGDEQDVGGALREPAHVVGIPGLAKRDVEAQAVAFGGQPALQVAADAVQHLELESIALDLALGGEGLSLPDDVLVVGGNGGVGAPQQQELHQLDEVA